MIFDEKTKEWRTDYFQSFSTFQSLLLPFSASTFYLLFSAVIPIKTIVSIGNKVKVEVFKFNSFKYVRLHLISRVKKRWKLPQV